MATIELLDKAADKTFSSAASATWFVRISTINEDAKARIPPYSTINKVTMGVDIKRGGINLSTSNTDVVFCWGNENGDIVGSYILHKTNVITTSYKSFSADITSYFNSGNELAGQVTIDGATRLNFRGEGDLPKDYYFKNRFITVDYTPPPTWEYKVFPGTNNCFLTRYNGMDTDVTVPSTIDGYTVTRLGYGFKVNDFGGSEAASKVTGAAYYGTFSENSKITSVTIPSTVNWIGYQTFRKCTALKTINWNPSQPCIIGRTSINNCTSLTNFTVPDNIKEVYAYVFQNSTALTRLDFKNKNVVFKTAKDNNAVPTNMFNGTSDSLVLGLYHNVASNIAGAITGKTIYYYDAAVSFISDGTTLKSDYVDIGAKPTAPTEPVKDGYTFSGWSDGTSIYASDSLPAIKNNSSGAIDATYTAVFERNRINNIYSGAVNANVYIGASEVSAVYVGSTKIYG